MADYTIISDISSYIVRMLRKKMCPEPIPSPNNIEISSPADQEVDYILGLYLYDICEEAQASVGTMHGMVRWQNTPTPYALYYMLFINGSSQMGLKAMDIQKILGKTAQVLNDGKAIFANQLQTWLEHTEPPILLSPAKLQLENKVRIWQAINKPYQVALFYKVAPVFLSSEIMLEPPRVINASFELHLTGEERGEEG